MMIRKWSESLVRLIVISLFLSAAARCADTDFPVFVNPQSSPPTITDVKTTPAEQGDTSFQITAHIQGQVQRHGACDLVPQSDCIDSDWYLISSQTVSPNPPQIKLARVYYYPNGDLSRTSFVNMSYDSAEGVWKADVPLDATLVLGDTVTTYIVAVDGMGNVASELPSTTKAPCTAVDNWDADSATPAIDSCAHALTSYWCNDWTNKPPGACGTMYTLGDMSGDVCGKPDRNGIQHLITGALADKMDILGFSTGADDTNLCVNMGLKAPPPDVIDPAPMEAYVLFFFNPDILDSNPSDMHMKNLFVISYLPKATGSDPTLVRVLWDGECFTNPATSDPMDCKLISSTTGASSRLGIAYDSGGLRFQTHISGTGDVLSKPYSLIGSSSNSSVIFAATLEINLSGGTSLWMSDLSQPMNLYRRNKTVRIGPDFTLPGPLITQTSCSIDGSASGTTTCVKSQVRPASNACRLDFSAGVREDLTVGYNIYRNTQNNPDTARVIATIDESGLQAYAFTDKVKVLDGARYHYWITSFARDKAGETELKDAAHASCTVEDWADPTSPVMTGMEHSGDSCTPFWTAIKDKDPIIAYTVYRCEGLKCSETSTWEPVNGDIAEGQKMSVLDQDVMDDTVYLYCVTATDRSGNESEILPTTQVKNCRPCKPGVYAAPPTNVVARSLVSDNAIAGIDIYWTRSRDDQGTAGGYRIYRCSDSACNHSQPVAGMGCTTLSSNGNLMAGMGPNKPIRIEGEPGESWYYGVTFLSDCSDDDTESFLAGVSVAISERVNVIKVIIDNCSSRWLCMSSCRDQEKSHCSPVTGTDTSQKGVDGKFLKLPYTGIEVFMADEDNKMIGSPGTTDSEGNFFLVIDNNAAPLDLSKQYKLVLKFPSSNKKGIPCDRSFADAQGSCFVILDSKVVIKNVDGITYVRGISVPFSGGGRAEVGNANCDSVVDMVDLILFRSAFGTTQGDVKYETWLDANGDGVVDIQDFLIFKTFFGKELDAAPTYDPTLCRPQ